MGNLILFHNILMSRIHTYAIYEYAYSTKKQYIYTNSEKEKQQTLDMQFYFSSEGAKIPS